MNRQKLSVHTLICLLACATAACSNDLEQKEIPTQGEGERITVTATAGMPQGQPSTRVYFKETGNKLTITWRPISDSEGTETFSVLSGTGSTTPSTFTMQSGDASSATFTGEITPANGTTYYAVYPALDATASATTIPLNMTGQKGDALDEKKVYMYSSSTYNAGSALNFGFKHLTSIVKVTLEFPEELAEATVSEVTFIATGGLYTSANVDITAAAVNYSDQTSDPLTLDGSFLLSSTTSPSATVYLHVLPGTLTDFKVRATADGKSYIGTIAASAPIDAGKMYTTTVEMKDPFANAQIGDFYCKGSDDKGYLIPGNAELTEAQERVCVGIVYWVGSEAFKEDPWLDSKHPDCLHGLVVALQNAGSEMNWSKQSEPVQNWVKDNYSGVNIQIYNKMCGYSNTLALMAYNKGKEANDEYRVLPCDAILDYSKKNPAPTNSSGWYLPSTVELRYVCRGQNNNAQVTTGKDRLNTQINKVAGGTPFGYGYYWSSTEDNNNNSNNNASYVNFSSGFVGSESKTTDGLLVRPILAF